MAAENGFEMLPHTADMRMKVRGQTLKGLFRSALQGVASFLKPEALQLEKRLRKERQQIKIRTVDLNSLLVDFLSEVIAQSDIKNVIFTDITFREFGENFLEGELSGVKVDGFERDIKAVSYNEVDVKKKPETGLFETILVFDI